MRVSPKPTASPLIGRSKALDREVSPLRSPRGPRAPTRTGLHCRAHPGCNMCSHGPVGGHRAVSRRRRRRSHLMPRAHGGSPPWAPKSTWLVSAQSPPRPAPSPGARRAAAGPPRPARGPETVRACARREACRRRACRDGRAAASGRPGAAGRCRRSSLARSTPPGSRRPTCSARARRRRGGPPGPLPAARRGASGDPEGRAGAAAGAPRLGSAAPPAGS
mmetsp:Transcript_69290/g.196345  ORF Transcript_69290/g.196345 Transcript_69290/m.196345 type:complete len:220 (+) Transcript_69290:15-674(+)